MIEILLSCMDYDASEVNKPARHVSPMPVIRSPCAGFIQQAPIVSSVGETVQDTQFLHLRFS